MVRTNTDVTGTPKGRALGAALREARNEAKLTLRALAKAVDMDHSVLSRYESGERSPRAEDVASILMAVGVSGERREEILELTRGADDPRWLGIGLPEQNRQMEALLDMERTATRLTDVSPSLVPGLLQTSDYTRAIMAKAGFSAGKVGTKVAMRIGRREEALRRRKPAQMTALVGEAALRQVIGGREVMADQLEFLTELAEWPNVTLRVLPLNGDWHPGLNGPYFLIEFAKGHPVVHLETLFSAVLLHEPIDVQPYRDSMPAVLDAAMSTTDSFALITEIGVEYRKSRS